MTSMIVPFIILCIGLLGGVLLFFRNPLLPGTSCESALPTISVIIPARNEEHNLPNILGDLRKQSVLPLEVICVDDGSMDNTAQTATEYGATRITVKNKPEGWTGKSYACQLGADNAQGDLLLFLDADVRLSEKAVEKLIHAYLAQRCTISVQPYHKVQRFYEHLSLFFNLIMIAANGVSVPFRAKNIGLFGPVILMDAADYRHAGGHTGVKSSIVDDLTLGENLRTAGLRFRLFLGGKDISFRMYAGGLRQLQQGWTKNFATGASKTSLFLVAMIVLWIAVCTTGVINFIELAFAFSYPKLAESLLVYGFLVAELMVAARKVGSFSKAFLAVYPLALAFFFAIFGLSVIKKIFHIKVKWKGRKI